MLRSVLLVLILGLAAAPALAQSEEPLCIIFVTPSADFSEVEIVVDLILTDEERADLVRRADADGDGNVTREEADAFEAGNTTHPSPSALGERTLRLDGELPTNVTIVTRLRLGPQLNASEERRFVFATPAADADSHRLRGGEAAEYEPRVVVETVVFRAPPGWLVWHTDQGVHLEREVVVQGIDVRGGYTVSFLREGASLDPEPQPEPERPSPSAGAAALALALVGAAFVRRARGR